MGNLSCKLCTSCAKPKKSPPLSEEEAEQQPQPGGSVTQQPQPGGSVTQQPQPGGSVTQQPQPGGSVTQQQLEDAPRPYDVENGAGIAREQNPQEPSWNERWMDPARRRSAMNLGLVNPAPQDPGAGASVPRFPRAGPSVPRFPRAGPSVASVHSSAPTISDPGSEVSDGPACCRCGAVDKPPLNSWSENCVHVFCRDCLSSYLGAMAENRIWLVDCPAEGCLVNNTAEECGRYLPEIVGNLWVQSIPEAARNA